MSNKVHQYTWTGTKIRKCGFPFITTAISRPQPILQGTVVVTWWFQIKYYIILMYNMVLNIHTPQYLQGTPWYFKEYHGASPKIMALLWYYVQNTTITCCQINQAEPGANSMNQTNSCTPDTWSNSTGLFMTSRSHTSSYCQFAIIQRQSNGSQWE